MWCALSTSSGSQVVARSRYGNMYYLGRGHAELARLLSGDDAERVQAFLPLVYWPKMLRYLLPFPLRPMRFLFSL